MLSMLARSSKVALLTEGVDRNADGAQEGVEAAVALLTEGVDRNVALYNSLNDVGRRPPHGGRG